MEVPPEQELEVGALGPLEPVLGAEPGPASVVVLGPALEEAPEPVSEVVVVQVPLELALEVAAAAVVDLHQRLPNLPSATRCIGFGRRARSRISELRV